MFDSRTQTIVSRPVGRCSSETSGVLIATAQSQGPVYRFESVSAGSDTDFHGKLNINIQIYHFIIICFSILDYRINNHLFDYSRAVFHSVSLKPIYGLKLLVGCSEIS